MSEARYEDKVVPDDDPWQCGQCGGHCGHDNYDASGTYIVSSSPCEECGETGRLDEIDCPLCGLPVVRGDIDCSEDPDWGIIHAGCEEESDQEEDDDGNDQDRTIW